MLSVIGRWCKEKKAERIELILTLAIGPGLSSISSRDRDVGQGPYPKTSTSAGGDHWEL